MHDSKKNRGNFLLPAGIENAGLSLHNVFDGVDSSRYIFFAEHFSQIDLDGAAAIRSSLPVIITGIGFIRAGDIFKDRLSILGLTIAAVIWIAAGIGMAAGIG